jgi:hypothetical protein
VVAVSCDSRPGKKIAPGQRKVAKWRESMKTHGIEFDESDLPANPFGKLNDDEWGLVWGAAKIRLPAPTAEIESNLRAGVDDAAISSGWFTDHIIHSVNKSVLKASIDEKKRYLQSAERFRAATAAMIGPEHDSAFDPYSAYRRMLTHLDEFLIAGLRHQICREQERAKRTPKRQSAEKPERDLWMAQLAVCWRDDCGLEPSDPALMKFIVAAMRPHCSVGPRAAKYFLDRWRKGEIEEPQPSLSRRIRTDKLKSL